MHKIKLAALLAATVLGATTADAATFIRYEITALGQQTGMSSLGEKMPLAYTGFKLTYQFPVFPGQTMVEFHRADGGDSFLYKVGSYTFTPTEVQLSESHEAHHFYNSYNTSFCADTQAGFVTAFNGTPACGTMNVNYGDWNNGNPIGYHFNGQITSLVALTFEGDQYETAFGVMAVATAVPEPASWALLLLGFGVTGYVMRRQRRLIATI